MSRALRLWSSPTFNTPRTVTIIDEKAGGNDSTSIQSSTNESTLTSRLATIASKISENLMAKSIDTSDTQEKKNCKHSLPTPLAPYDIVQLSEKLEAVKADQLTAEGSPSSEQVTPAALKPECPSVSSIRQVSIEPTERPQSIPYTPQRSTSTFSASNSTLRLGSVSRSSFASGRSISTGSLYSTQIYSPAFRPTARSPNDPRFLRVKRQSRYLGTHPSNEQCHRYNPIMHRSISLPPLLEDELQSTATSVCGEDQSSLRSEASTLSRASRVSGLRLQMNGPDHKGWTKVVADYQIKEVITSPSTSLARLPSFMANLEGWQMDGTADDSISVQTIIRDKTERKYQSSDSDRVTRGSSEVVWRDGTSDDEITKENEERGKEEEWERRQTVADLDQSNEQKQWRQVLRQTWERARFWFGFRFLSW